MDATQLLTIKIIFTYKKLIITMQLQGILHYTWELKQLNFRISIWEKDTIPIVHHYKHQHACPADFMNNRTTFPGLKLPISSCARDRVGAVIRALASHQSGLDVCGLRLLLVFALVWGFFSCFSCFPPSTKTSVSKFQFRQDENQLIRLARYILWLIYLCVARIHK